MQELQEGDGEMPFFLLLATQRLGILQMMFTPFLTEAVDAELRKAVATIESRSQAEVVIAARRRAATWLHVYVVIGGLAAFVTLGLMLRAAHPFHLRAIWIDPFVVGLLTGAAASLITPLERWLTPSGIRRRAVRRAALVAFHECGVRRTTRRTGILICLSLVEKQAEVVADDGVVTALPEKAWADACAAIDRAVARGGSATVRAIAELAPLLSAYLPRTTDDVNELPDEIKTDVDDAANASRHQAQGGR